MRPSRAVLGVTTVIAGLTLVVSCTSSTNNNAAPTSSSPAAGADTSTATGTGAGTTEGTATTSASSSPAGTGSDSGGLQRADTLYVGTVGSAMTQLGNPLLSSATPEAGQFQGMYEALFYLNWFSGKLEPWLATSAEFNDTNTEVTVKLREGVTWADGKPFTSADVKYTVDAELNNATLKMSPLITQTVASVSAPNDHEVVFKLTGPNPMFVQSVLSGTIANGLIVVPEHIFAGQDPTKFTFWDPAKGWPFGTGPYIVKSTTDQLAVLTRRDDWWAAKTGFHALPAPKNLVYENVTNEVAAQMLVSDQLDASPGINGLGIWQSIGPKNSNLSVWDEGGTLDPCPLSLEYNTRRAPWNDPEMRWALAYSIDTQKWSRVFNETTGSVTGFIYPAFPVLQSVLADNKAIFDQYNTIEYAPDKAATILKAHGYTLVNNKWVDKNNNPLTLNLAAFAPSVAAAWGVGRELLTSDLEKNGITVKSQALDFGGLISLRGSGDFDAMTWFECGSVSTPSPTLAAYTTSLQNSTWGWSNKDYDAAVEKLQSLPDQFSAEGKALTTQALTIFMKELPTMELSQAQKSYIVNNKYWTNWPNAKNPYFQMFPQLIGFHQVLLNLKAAG